MTAWYIVSALVTLDAPDTAQQVLRIPTHDDNIRNHQANLTAQGFRVIDIKVLPWYEEVTDVVYEADPTPNIEDVLGDGSDYGVTPIDQNNDTTKTARSSD